MVLLWDRKFTDVHVNCKTWSAEVRDIFNFNELGYFFDNTVRFSIENIIGTLTSKMRIKQNENLRLRCIDKPQLRTFVKLKNFDQKPAFLQKPLSFYKENILVSFVLPV